jgi:acetyl-CoA C-acetyltransferase
MASHILIAGVGMVPFRAPGQSGSCDAMAEGAVRAALADARLDYELIDEAFASFVLADAGAAQRALYRVGMTGIPIANVGNNGASGAGALHLARQAVLSGDAECVLAVGFDEAPNDATASTAELQRSSALLEWLRRERGVTDETFARVVVKARAHAASNPYAMRRDPLTLDAVLSAPTSDRLARESYASSPSSGAAAIVLCTARFAARHGVPRGVALLAQVLTSDTTSDLEAPNGAELPGMSATLRASRRAYALAGVGPEDIDAAEVHDSCVGNELMVCASLGFCADGDFERFVLEGDNTYGGKMVVGPSGGLQAMGHSPGATGLAQIVELAWHLRGEAGSRQVRAARTGLAHNGGPGSPISVSIVQAVR